MSIKVAVVLLVVVAALFATAIVVGAKQDDSSANDENALVNGLGERVGDPSAVPRADVTAGCVDEDDPDLLVFTGGCTVVVQSGEPLRLLGILALSDLDVEAPAPDQDDLEVEAEVAAGDTVRVAVAEGTTEIDLSCGLLAECQARLVAE